MLLYLLCDKIVPNLVTISCDNYKTFNMRQTNHNNFVKLIMQPLSATQCNHILSLLEAGQSVHQISSTTGVHTSTISRLRRKHHPYLPKSSGGCPTKLSPSNIHHGIHLISTGKAENAVQVTKALQDITNKPLSAQTT